jgi:hypothetical protein
MFHRCSIYVDGAGCKIRYGKGIRLNDVHWQFVSLELIGFASIGQSVKVLITGGAKQKLESPGRDGAKKAYCK